MSRFWTPSSDRGHGSRAPYELPRWQTPSPMAASLIPPPIVQSTHTTLMVPEPSSRSSVFLTEDLPLHDRQEAVEADIQFLLDAQAEGLMRGLEGGEEVIENRSAKSASSSYSGSQRYRRKPGLRSARAGIYRSILALSSLKDDELDAINTRISRSEHDLTQIDAWERKRRGLQDAADQVNDANEATRVRRLQQQADKLQSEINQAELQLTDMKARHRDISKHIAAVENTVKAKMASYTNSLEQMEEDVRRFLTLRPSEDASIPSSRSDDIKTSVWELPPARRTLEMAKTELATGCSSAKRQREQIRHEKKALHDGAEMWQRVIHRVGEFERQLRTEMATHTLPSSSSDGAWEDDPQQQTTARDRMDNMLKRLTAVIGQTESDITVADTQNWKLLVAAIGAELHALRQGKELLMKALKAVHGDSDQASPELATYGELLSQNRQGADRAADLGASNQTLAVVDTNEDPDPELMFSRRDIDD